MTATSHLATIIGSPGAGDMAAAYAATTFNSNQMGRTD